MFDRPPMFNAFAIRESKMEAVKVNRDLKDERIEIQGKWQNIRHLIAGLMADGWRIKDELTGEPSGFKFTEVTLER